MANNIVNNTGQNYSLYYNVLDFFGTIMQNHPSIGQVSQGDLYGIDDKEFPIYPLGNILITNVGFSINETILTCQLTIADKVKLKNNESSGSYNQMSVPYYDVDDTVDIHSNTLSILNDLTAFLQRGVQGFEINDRIDCVPFKDTFDNGLAGWVATFDLTSHNDRNRCLFDLYPQS
jgi:hypothetical protein